MSRRRSVIKTIEAKEISPYYDMSVNDLEEILENSKDIVDTAVISFYYGYVLGERAAKAEQKKGAAK